MVLLHQDIISIHPQLKESKSDRAKTKLLFFLYLFNLLYSTILYIDRVFITSIYHQSMYVRNAGDR